MKVGYSDTKTKTKRRKKTVGVGMGEKKTAKGKEGDMTRRIRVAK